MQRLEYISVLIVYLQHMFGIKTVKYLSACVVFLLNLVVVNAQTEANKHDHASYQKVLNDVLVQGQLFRENQGQWDNSILYQTSGNGATAAFYSDKILFSLVKDWTSFLTRRSAWNFTGWMGLVARRSMKILLLPRFFRL